MRDDLAKETADRLERFRLAREGYEKHLANLRVGKVKVGKKRKQRKHRENIDAQMDYAIAKDR